jgi:23S rRNA pseudouridine1911/1915/1917 synthase
MDERKTVRLKEDGRLDRVLAQSMDRSRSRIQKTIERGEIRVEGEPTQEKSMTVTRGTRVSVPVVSEQGGEDPVPEEGPLNVLYEDEHLLILDKPAGMLVHPTSNRRKETLVNRILHHYPDQNEVGDSERAGLVHRLDQGTSGVIIVARNEQSLSMLKDQFRERRVQKLYRSIVDGELADDSLKIDVPIGRDPENPTLRCADPTGKPSVTIVERDEFRDGRSTLWCRPRTGRTHQIRVHLKYIGHPIVGDPKYSRNDGERLMLHAESIEFLHPVSDNPLRVKSDPPHEVLQAWNAVSTSS